jgi:hypothetical protein
MWLWLWVWERKLSIRLSKEGVVRVYELKMWKLRLSCVYNHSNGLGGIRTSYFTGPSSSCWYNNFGTSWWVVRPRNLGRIFFCNVSILCIGTPWFRTCDSKVSCIVFHPLDHEACSVNKATKRPDKVTISERLHSFCRLSSLFSHPHCNSTNTDITARHQKYEYNDSIKFIGNTAVSSHCMNVSWLYQCILPYHSTYKHDVTTLISARLRTLRAKATYGSEESGLFGYDTVSLGRQCWVGLCMPRTLDGRSYTLNTLEPRERNFGWTALHCP